MGWGSRVGWVGDDDVLCTCTHVTCYATAGVVGWDAIASLELDRMVDAMALCRCCTCAHVLCPQPCGNWREDATRVSRQTGVGLHLASIGGKKN